MKHFLQATVEGLRLELEMPFPVSPSKPVASGFFQYKEYFWSWVLVSCSGGHISSPDEAKKATCRQTFNLIPFATWKMWDLIQKNSWARVIYNKMLPSEGLHWPYKPCEWIFGVLPSLSGISSTLCFAVHSLWSAFIHILVHKHTFNVPLQNCFLPILTLLHHPRAASGWKIIENIKISLSFKEKKNKKSLLECFFFELRSPRDASATGAF